MPVDDEVFRDILDPTGRLGVPVAGPAHAERPDDLDGVRVGLLSNTKQNADLLLATLGSLLSTRYGAVVTAEETKHAFALPLDEPLLKEMAAECDVAVIGVGDCGSCIASAIADGIAFEREGIPTAVICSDAFDLTARAMAEVQGDKDYRYLTTAHPVAVLSPRQVEQRAGELLPLVAARLRREQA